MIHINRSVPDFTDDGRESSPIEFYEHQADMIVDALQTHLPGGTLDAVIDADDGLRGLDVREVGPLSGVPARG